MSEEFKKRLYGKKIVVDTSTLLLTGTSLLQVLPECELIIPSVVIRELEDNRSQTTVGFLSREWLRLLEELRVNHGETLKTGVKIPNTEVVLRIEPNHSTQKNLPEYLRDGSHDSTILSVAYNLSAELESMEGERSVIVLSNDNPMRLHATLDLGVDAIEFSAAHLMKFEPYSGFEKIYITEDEYQNLAEKSVDHTLFLKEKTAGIVSNNYVLMVYLEGDTRPVLDYMVLNDVYTPLHTIRKQKAKKIVGKSLEQDVAMVYLSEPSNDIPVVSISGGAGTGKTIITIATGIELVEKGDYNKLIIFRSLHEMGKGQELGFLPGDLDDKMSVWAGAVNDAMDVIAKRNHLSEDSMKRLKSIVEVQPITYLRGRNLTDSYVVLDEAQNFSRSELLNILSRAGEGTKIVLLFDASQVDNRFLQSGKYADIWSVVESLKSKGIAAHVNLTKTERSRVAAIAAELLQS